MSSKFFKGSFVFTAISANLRNAAPSGSFASPSCSLSEEAIEGAIARHLSCAKSRGADFPRQLQRSPEKFRAVERHAAHPFWGCFRFRRGPHARHWHALCFSETSKGDRRNQAADSPEEALIAIDNDYDPRAWSRQCCHMIGSTPLGISARACVSRCASQIALLAHYSWPLTTGLAYRKLACFLTALAMFQS
jgi:hypothetical protein